MRASVICLVASWLTLTSNAGATPGSIACIGDSITQGVGASSASTDWVSDLGGLLGAGVDIGNYGVSSTTMMKQSNMSYWDTGDLALVETFVTDAEAGASVAVIIMLGTNDSKDNPSGVDNWTSTAPTRYAADYNSMLDELLGLIPPPDIFLVLPPPAFANSYDIDGTVIEDQIIPIIVSIATERELPIIDVHSALAGMSGLFPDGVHPSDMGHMLIATTMANGLLLPAVPARDGGAADASAPADAASPSDGAASSDAFAPADASVASDASNADSNDGTVVADAGAGEEASESDGGAAASGSNGCTCTTARSTDGPGRACWVLLAIFGAIRVRGCRRAPRQATSCARIARRHAGTPHGGDS